MKKLFIVSLCLGIVFGLTSCGSKKLTDPAEIYEKVKGEGYKMENKSRGTNSCSITLSKPGLLIDDFYLNGDHSFTVKVNENDSSYILLLPDEKKEELNFGVVYIGDCTMAYDKEDNIGNSCSATQISDAKDMKKQLTKFLDEIGIDENGLLDLFKWYIEENNL